MTCLNDLVDNFDPDGRVVGQNPPVMAPAPGPRLPVVTNPEPGQPPGDAGIEPCQLYWNTPAGRDAVAANVGGRAVCYNGVKYACVRESGIDSTLYNNRKARGIIASCIRQHERAGKRVNP